jgi:hypothetical protein
MKDMNGREYARLSQLRPGTIVQVDGDFEGCFLPWSKLEVVEVDGELALYHNVPECGACGGGTEPCAHGLEGQLADDNDDSLIGVYLT